MVVSKKIPAQAYVNFVEEQLIFETNESIIDFMLKSANTIILSIIPVNLKAKSKATIFNALLQMIGNEMVDLSTKQIIFRYLHVFASTLN